MKSSTYGFFIMLAFLGGLGEKFDTIADLIKSADGIARDMGCNPNLNNMTKYNVVKELEKDALIVLHKERHNVIVVLKDNVEEFVVEWALAIEEDDKK